jgi:hypothetical protein
MESARLTSDRVARSLGEMMQAPSSDVVIRDLPNGHASGAMVQVGPIVFLIEWRSSGDATHVASALDQLRTSARRAPKRAIPLVVVPFMGSVGSELCEKAGVAWLDLSGNAHIVAPAVRVHVQGRPNRFKRKGRPSTVFAPKSARIARWLLIHAEEAFSQRELARATGVDEGLTSRIVKRLEQDELVARDDRGAVRVAKPDALLDAFREAYDFNKHAVTHGHVAARSGDALLGGLTDSLKRRDVEYAVTGLGAAWLWSRFAAFRLLTVYLHEPASPSLLAEIGFREESRGANVWLVVPNDEGVFHGASEREGVPCVHPVQVYLDLKDQPERAGEAATKLRSELLNWRRNA